MAFLLDTVFFGKCWGGSRTPVHFVSWESQKNRVDISSRFVKSKLHEPIWNQPTKQPANQPTIFRWILQNRRDTTIHKENLLRCHHAASDLACHGQNHRLHLRHSESSTDGCSWRVENTVEALKMAETCGHLGIPSWIPGWVQRFCFEGLLVLNMIILKPYVAWYLNHPPPVKVSWTCKKGSARIDMAVQGKVSSSQVCLNEVPQAEYPWVSNVSANYMTKPQNHTDSHCWFNSVYYKISQMAVS